MTAFKNRVFGCAIVKAINANYNADFTHQPRTLPDGTVYATDKAFKYSLRNYLFDTYPDETIFFYKRLNKDMNPLTLAETYQVVLGDFEKEDKPVVLKKLLGCLDIKLFGATFAAKSGKKKINLSVHGPVQINHGMNRFPANEIYSEQIMSPFRNPGEEGSDEKAQATLGQQSKLREGHYVHHFSINPKNLEDMGSLVEGVSELTTDDIAKLKEAMLKGVTYFDSASKAGTDNEFLLWIQLKPGSRLVMPVFTEYITVYKEAEKTIIDFGGIKDIIQKATDEIELIEAYFYSQNVLAKNLPDNIRQIEMAAIH